MDLFLMAIFTQVADSVAIIVPEPEAGGDWVKLLLPVLTVVVTYLTMQVMKFVKWASELLAVNIPFDVEKFVSIDGYPASLQRLILLGIAAGLIWLGGQLGVPMPEFGAMIGESDISGALMALGTFGLAAAFHSGDKKKK